MADICQLVLRSIRRSTYDRRDHNDLSKPGANNCYLSSWHPAADEFLLWDPHWPLGSSIMISLEAIALESGTIIQSFKYCDSELRWYAFLSLIYLNRRFAVGLLVGMFLCFHGTDVWIILSGSAFIRLPSDIGYGSKCWDFFEFHSHLLCSKARSRFRGFGRTLSIHSFRL